MNKFRVVIFVDLRDRDLMGDALIAYQLEKRGIECFLEPLESWQAAIYAHKPHLVLYNHLITKKLCDFSQKMKNYGILVGCLLNEGLGYTDSSRTFLSQRHDETLHCDLFLCWNDLHRDLLRELNFCTPAEKAITTGCPRFDFYSKPWSDSYTKKVTSDSRPHILVNATFALAHYYTLPREEADKLFADAKGKVAGTEDYWKLISDHYYGREKLPSFITPLLESDKYRITIRPHPREELSFYQDWFDTLPPEQRALIDISTNESPPRPIFQSDIVINCEDCTTSMEAWLAGKPTISLAFEQNPYWFTDTYKRLSPIIEQSTELEESIQLALAEPEQSLYNELRKQHLEKWLHTTKGDSSAKVADAILATILEKKTTPKTPKQLRFLWKGWKLLFFRSFNQPYNFKFKHLLRQKLGSKGQDSIKFRDYLKAVRPDEAADVISQIRKLDQTNSTKA